MPYKRPRFWLEMLLLGFLLVFGMTTLQLLLPQGWWGSIVRILYAAALFGTYGLYFERTWSRGA